ncbi:insulinoma-associated protein 1 [Drosophila kikkawai]|uniref:Insulinoma-associated protein 1 n=1 Tax=Drosophila kikkawai TaxID=30033 RepID=A0A6P4IP92_DROKI|nr:uncharacterized protein LOC108080519 [Drosophila kikkawai]
MFTNWLTGSTTSTSSGGSSTPALTRSSGLGGLGSLPGSIAGNASSLVMSSPPDVILEVGPAPSSVRFVAHSLVLGMHSGYLRSAIRLDEASTMATIAAAAAANGNSSSSVAAAGGSASGELLLYLSNVTADQFAPLLTYMYTGYLDLTVDNIFAVLLATHVLHMPRALEICRSFLARAQTEGYLNGNPGQLCPAAVPSNVAKVIRPIPSKATMPNFGFMPHMPQATPPSAAAAAAVPPPPPPPPAPAPTPVQAPPPPAVFLNMEVANSPRYHEEDNDEEEDIEVFIDSNTVTDNELDLEQEPEPDVDMDCNVSVVSSLAGSSAGSLNIERLDVKPTPAILPTAPNLVAPPPASGKLSKSKREQNQQKCGQGKKGRSRKGGATSSGSGLQVAKAPVPAAQLEPAGTTTTTQSVSKFIIDVASCDGPVRFRRILNTAYGHKPEDHHTAAGGGGGVATGGASGSAGATASEQHRSQQSVSYSFHQQMARAISSQQRQQQQQQLEESENSGDAPQPAASNLNSSRKHSNTGSGGGSASTSGGSSSNQELYVCVYCKHTFKSQYCYQKHAKRHLNPLSLTTTTTTTTTGGEKKLLAAEPPTTLASLEAETQIVVASAASTATAAPSSIIAGATGAALLRREVRPLDMNVQYYPCKTCGSKFPSYYFVHKHRKMCHAEEIEATNNNTSNASSSSSSNNSSSNLASKREVATAPAQGPPTAVLDTPGEDPQAGQQQN